MGSILHLTKSQNEWCSSGRDITHTNVKSHKGGRMRHHNWGVLVAVVESDNLVRRVSVTNGSVKPKQALDQVWGP